MAPKKTKATEPEASSDSSTSSAEDVARLRYLLRVLDDQVADVYGLTRDDVDEALRALAPDMGKLERALERIQEAKGPAAPRLSRKPGDHAVAAVRQVGRVVEVLRRRSESRGREGVLELLELRFGDADDETLARANTSAEILWEIRTCWRIAVDVASNLHGVNLEASEVDERLLATFKSDEILAAVAKAKPATEHRTLAIRVLDGNGNARNRIVAERTLKDWLSKAGHVDEDRANRSRGR